MWRVCRELRLQCHHAKERVFGVPRLLPAHRYDVLRLIFSSARRPEAALRPGLTWPHRLRCGAPSASYPTIPTAIFNHRPSVSSVSV